MQGAGAGASALQLLGLRARGLPAACAAPLALTTALFAGPLLLLAWPARLAPRGPPCSAFPACRRALAPRGPPCSAFPACRRALQAPPSRAQALEERRRCPALTAWTS